MGSRKNSDDKKDSDTSGTKNKENTGSSSLTTAVLAIVPLVVLAGMVYYILGPASDFIEHGNPLPEVTVEKINFLEDEITATIRNTGPIPVEIVQADVNDRIVPAAIEPDKELQRFETAKLRIPFVWNEGQAYSVGVTIGDGTRFSKEVEAASMSPQPNPDLIGYFALIGTYVGIVPVMIGLLWFPLVAKISANKYRFFLALTAGLLIFLGIDAFEEALEISADSIASSFNGALLVVVVSILSFLGLNVVAEKMVSRSSGQSESTSSALAKGTGRMSKPVAIALMISVGIGLHNLGEGLAIGAAVALGEVALSTFLIVGFAIHNTTEGLAIASPMAKSGNRTSGVVGKLAMMGFIAGVPAIFGGWIGGFVYSPIAAIIFLGIGIGAIFQVVYSVLKWIKEEKQSHHYTTTQIDSDKGSLKETVSRSYGLLADSTVVLGISIGLLIMYVTGILA